MSRLLLTPLVLPLSLLVKGVSQSKLEENEDSSKWTQISKNFAFNTAEIGRKQDKFIFFDQRTATKDEFEGQSKYR